MSSGLIQLFKQTALDAMENSQVCDLRFGEVVSIEPLKIKVTNQLTIPSSLLFVPEHLTKREVPVYVDWYTENPPDDSSVGEHNHSVNGSKTIIIDNELRIGDRVALLRKQGGQSYFILDRI